MPTTFPANTYGHMIVNTAGIVHYMRMDDTSGSGDDADSLTGTTHNVSTRQTGALVGDDDRSFYFNGSSSYVNYGNNINLVGNFSLEIWIKPARLSGTQTFASKENYVGAYSGWSWYLDGSIPCFSRLLGSRYTVRGTALAVNQWAHLVVTYDGITLRHYRNGVQVWDTPGGGTIYTSGYSAILGAATNGQMVDRYEHYQGNLDEFAVYNRALSASTILQHYNRGITSPVTNLTLSRSNTGALGGTAARQSLTSSRTRTETTTLRGESSATFFNTKTASTTGAMSVSESAEVIMAFGGIRVNREDNVTVSATEAIAIATSVDLTEDFTVLAAEDQNLFANTSVNETLYLNHWEGGVSDRMVNISEAYPDLVRRRQGFIHFAAQRLFNGNITIEYKQTPNVRVREKYPSALGTFVLGSSKLGDESAVSYALSDLYFLVRNEYGMPVALGTATTDWYKGTIVVDFVENMEEQRDVLKTFGIFPSTAG